MTSFKSFDLSPLLLKSLDQMKITVPTEIQSKTIPVALTGVDILASAETGSGKTLSYLIPVINKLSTSCSGTALVLAPTRELAMQVYKTVETLLGRNSIGGGVVLIIGGQSIYKQQLALRKNPKIIIGTPGRINDLLSREDLNLSKCNFLVLDEIDRMLDMGFIHPIEKIISQMPSERQTFMFSATIPAEIKKLSQRFLKNPQFISANSNQVANRSIKQEVLQISSAEKFPQLLAELEKREGAVIIFVETKFGADKLVDRLCLENHKSVALHGNLRQNRREQVVKQFKDMYSRILVATDIAARGLDISHVKHVINYELPRCPEDYVHRIGRTGRAGAEGNAISFVTSNDDVYRWKGIFKIVGEDLPKLKDNSFSSKNSFSKSPRQRRDSFRNDSPFQPRNNFKQPLEYFESRFNDRNTENKFQKPFNSHSKFDRKNNFNRDGFDKDNGFKFENKFKQNQKPRFFDESNSYKKEFDNFKPSFGFDRQPSRFKQDLNQNEKQDFFHKKNNSNPFADKKKQIFEEKPQNFKSKKNDFYSKKTNLNFISKNNKSPFKNKGFRDSSLSQQSKEKRSFISADF